MRSRPIAQPAARLLLGALLLALTLAIGCSNDCVDGCEADGGETDGGACGPVSLVIGGADKEGAGWVDWQAATATPPMIRGPQGGQHIWVRTRSRGLWQKKARLDVTMTLIDTGIVVKPGTVPVMHTLQPEGECQDLSPPITAYVKCPCQVVGRKVRVDVSLLDLYGVSAKAKAEITPTWDGDCSQPPSGNCGEQ